VKFHDRLPRSAGYFYSVLVDEYAAARQIRFRLRRACILLDTKFFDLRIKHELFARDQRNAQETSVTFQLFPRNALNKGMTFEQGGPNGCKIISLADQLGAMAREIAGSLLGHFHRPFGIKKLHRQSMPLTLTMCRRFAMNHYMRDKKCWRIFSMMQRIARNMSFHI